MTKMMSSETIHTVLRNYRHCRSFLINEMSNMGIRPSWRVLNKKEKYYEFRVEETNLGGDYPLCHHGVISDNRFMGRSFMQGDIMG